MKRAFILIVLVVVLLALAGCSAVGSPAGPAASDASSSSAAFASSAAAQDAAAAEEAFAEKLQQVMDEYGAPTVKTNRNAAYLGGLVYARLADFGDGERRLLLSYYDPAGDQNATEPGGALESYPVEVWEFDAGAGGLRQVYAGCAQLEGQNSYCSAIKLLSASDGSLRIYEREGIWTGPTADYSELVYGADADGLFGLLGRLDSLYANAAGSTSSSYRIDGEDATDDEAAEFVRKWLADGEAVFLTALGDRSVLPAYDQTMEALAELGIAADAPAPSDTVIETPYYTFAVPSSWGEATYEVQYEDEADFVDQQGMVLGCMTTVHVGEDSFTVCCYSDNWGPQGAYVSRNLGAPSGLPGYHVYAFAANPDYMAQTTPGGIRGIGDRIDEIASFVKLK